jgi:hypothetical protein
MNNNHLMRIVLFLFLPGSVLTLAGREGMIQKGLRALI